MLIQTLLLSDASKTYSYNLDSYSTISDTLSAPSDTLSVLHPTYNIATICPHSYTWTLTPSNDGFMSFTPAPRTIQYSVSSTPGAPNPSLGTQSYSVQLALIDQSSIVLDQKTINIDVNVYLDCSQNLINPLTAGELTRVYQIDLNSEYMFSDSLNGLILDNFSLQYPNLDIQTVCPHQYTSTVVPLD